MIGLRGGISFAIAIILCAALAVIGWAAERAARHTIVPEITAKANSVGRSAAALMERAQTLGIPFERLAGVTDYLEDLRAANAEFAQLSLFDAGGAETARAGDASGFEDPPMVRIPVTDRDGRRTGELLIVVDPTVVSAQVGGVLLDVAFIGIVSLLVALELVALVVGTRGLEALIAVEQRLRALARGRFVLHDTGKGTSARGLIQPIDLHMEELGDVHARARAEAERRGDEDALVWLEEVEERTGLGRIHAVESQAAVAVRPSLFLFMLAEELTRPFLPHFAQSIASSTEISPGLAASLPIVAFMAVVALGQVPFAGVSERLGRRSGFLIGALLAAAGYALSAVSPTYSLFIAARVATAIGYALVFVSAQGHVVDHSAGAARAAALAVFVRAIMVASLCGPPIGGVIADRLGAEAAFATSCGLALVALLVAAFTLPRGRPDERTGGVGWSQLKQAARAPGLMALLFGCAFPAKFLFAALCFLLVPLELQRQGYSSAAIGRFQMIYPLIMVLAVPFFAALADRFQVRHGFVVAGALVAGIGAMLVPLQPSIALIVVALVTLGYGQAMSIASQSALVADTASAMGGGRGAGVLGLFRLVERSGNAAGPASAGFLMAALGFAPATAFLGAVVVAGAVLFALSGRGKPAVQSGRASSAAASEGTSA